MSEIDATMKTYKALLVITLASFFVATVVFLNVKPNIQLDNLLNKYVIPNNYLFNNFDYAWVNSTSIIFLAKQEADDVFPVFSVSDRNLTQGLDERMAPLSKKSNLVFLSEDADWVLQNDSETTNFYMTEIGQNHAAYKLNIKIEGSRLFWQRRGSVLLQTKGGHGIMFNPSNQNGVVLNSSFSPLFPIGFSDKNLFICATNTLDSSGLYPDKLDLEYWKLGTNCVLQSKREISISRERIVSASISPTGTKILWLCYGQSAMNFLAKIGNLSDLLSSKKGRLYNIDFYVSSSEPAQFLYLGSLNTDNFPHIHWSSDGTRVSFVYNNQFCVLNLN